MFVAACQGTQVAIEDPDLGHGLLTAVVSRAIHERKTVREMLDAVGRDVPRLARRLSATQTPIVLDRWPAGLDPLAPVLPGR